jgi:biopolymer transport protein ExbD
MAFGGFRSRGHQQPLAEINMIPLIDVMLVLLVIFIVTAPLLTHAVKIDLPRVSSQPNLARAEQIQLAIRADGSYFWNGEPIDRAELAARLRAAGRQSPAPELHLRADQTAQYRLVADVLGEAGRAGVARIAFVSEPTTTR